MTGLVRTLPSKKALSPPKFRPVPPQLFLSVQLSVVALPPFQVLLPTGPLLTNRTTEAVALELLGPLTVTV